MASSIPSFLFGAGTKYKTQEELDRAREQVRDMLGDIGHSGLTGWGSALADLGKGISAGIEQRRIGEGQEIVSADQERLWEMFGGGGYSGADPDAIVATSGADTLPVGSAGADPVAQALARPPEASAPRGGGGDGYLRYANQGATRNKPLAPKLEKALGFLSDLGVTAEVFSGGQDASGPHRTGSHRHDYGNAGDIRFYKDGRQLSWANKADLPLFQEIVRRGKAAGITGFGAGPGYMGEGTMHVGFGTPSVWGAGGRSRNAPGWLTDAYSGRLVGGGGARGQAGGAGTDPMTPRAPFDLHNRFRITPAMLGPDEEPVPAPPPAPAPVPARNVPVNDTGLRTPAGADFLSRMGNPAPMGGQPLPMVPGMNGPMPPPQPPQPAPAPPPAPAPAPPAPPPQVDPFTDMILGDKAAQFKPGNYIPPAPVGKQAFPAAPPAPGTPAAAGFGVPPVVGGGGADQLAGKGTFPPAPAPPQAQQAGGITKIGKLMTILASPNATPEMKRMAAAMLDREYALEDQRRKAAADAANPLTKLELEKAQLEVEKLRKGEKRALINAGGGMLYDQDKGEWITAPAGPGGGGPFSGESVEAQALNGLVANGTLTAQQAYDLAAGKAITNPEDGSLVWMTPQGLVGGPPGQPPKVIVPTGGDTSAPQETPAAVPPSEGAQTPAGGRKLTGGKPGKLQSEGERRDQSLYSVILPELKIIETNFDALADPKSEMADQMPGGAYVATPEYQQAATSLRSFISSYLYSMSGAEAKTSEIETNFALLKPRAGEPDASKKDKLRRLYTMAEAIRLKGGGAPETAPAAGGGGNVDYNSIYGLPPVPK